MILCIYDHWGSRKCSVGCRWWRGDARALTFAGLPVPSEVATPVKNTAAATATLLDARTRHDNQVSDHACTYRDALHPHL